MIASSVQNSLRTLIFVALQGMYVPEYLAMGGFCKMCIQSSLLRAVSPPLEFRSAVEVLFGFSSRIGLQNSILRDDGCRDLKVFLEWQSWTAYFGLPPDFVSKRRLRQEQEGFMTGSRWLTSIRCSPHRFMECLEFHQVFENICGPAGYDE